MVLFEMYELYFVARTGWSGRNGTGGDLVGGLNLAGEGARRRIEKRERERVNASASLLSRHREKGEKEREKWRKTEVYTR